MGLDAPCTAVVINLVPTNVPIVGVSGKVDRLVQARGSIQDNVVDPVAKDLPMARIRHLKPCTRVVACGRTGNIESDQPPATGFITGAARAGRPPSGDAPHGGTVIVGAGCEFCKRPVAAIRHRPTLRCVRGPNRVVPSARQKRPPPRTRRNGRTSAPVSATLRSLSPKPQGSGGHSH
jgi:hypothetical protein